MTDETTTRRPRRRAASRTADMPDTHDAIEIAMKAIVTGADQHASARTVLEKHAVLLDVQSRREEEEWALLRLQRLTRWIFISAALIVLLGVAGTLWAASQSRSLIVEPFSVPPALAERGVNGEVVAARVLDRLAEMQRETSSVRAESSYSNNWQDNVEVNVLDAGFSIGEVWRALRQWLGKETRISGEIVAGPDGTLSMTTRAGVLSSAPVTSDTGDIDQLVRMGAEEVYSVTQPYRYGIFLQNNGRLPESEAILLALTRAADPLERPWGYNGLSVLHRARGEIDAALFNARQALEIDPRMVPALANVGSAYLRLGREEKGLSTTRPPPRPGEATIAATTPSRARPVKPPAKSLSLLDSVTRMAWPKRSGSWGSSLRIAQPRPQGSRAMSPPPRSWLTTGAAREERSRP